MQDRKHHVIVFHDETKGAGPDKYNGHVLFFVPQKLIVKDSDSFFNKDTYLSEPLKRLYEKILEARESFHQERPKFHFSSGVSGKRWSPMLDCYRKVSEIVVDALRHKGSQEFGKPLCCKMAVMFYPKDTNLSLYGGSEKKEKKLRHDETTM